MVYYEYIDLYIHIYVPNQAIRGAKFRFFFFEKYTNAEVT